MTKHNLHLLPQQTAGTDGSVGTSREWPQAPTVMVAFKLRMDGDRTRRGTLEVSEEPRLEVRRPGAPIPARPNQQ